MATRSVQIPGYEILRPLGRGGMSTVYLALQRSLDRKVAIKVMHRAGDDASEDAIKGEKRFLLEGRMMAKLPHRNIVAVYDIVSNDGIAYISMEYLGGGTLSERMHQGLPLSEAIAVVVQIASALGFAHGHGVVHRDLKPANIMFRDDATPVLTDFGIARMQDASATRLTQTGMLVGTPTYMSPEQINGDPVDGRADLYSLGVLFYEMLSGHAPFRGDTAIAVLMAHLNQPPPPLPAEFAAFQPVLDRMLAKNPVERYADMHEFSDDLKSRLVGSDTLLTRLRIDPNQTSSERLRALGFSSSTPSGGGLRDSLRDSLRMTPRAAASPAPRQPPGTRMPLWRWVAAAACIGLIAVGAWLMLRGHGGLSKEQQQVIALLLDHAGQLADKGALVEPVDENAYAYTQKVLDRDPQNDKAQALLQRIAGALTTRARQALDAGKLDRAEELDNQALLVRDDDPAAQALATRIAAVTKAAQRRAQVRNLLQRAQVAQAAGRVIGVDGAYALLVQARAEDPADKDVAQRIAGLLDDQLEASRKALASGDAAAASKRLVPLQAYFGTEPAFVTLHQEIDAAVQKQQLEQRISHLVAQARGQLRAGNLTEPDGANAYASLGQLNKLAADDARTRTLAGDVARALLDEARHLDAQGQSQRALEQVGLALQVAPQLSPARDLQQRIEQRLGARAAKLAAALGAARQAVAEQRFVPPAHDDAYTALRAALAAEPGNADARRLLDDLPRRIAAAANARAGTDAAGAAELVDSALRVFAGNSMLDPLSRQLHARVAEQAAAARVSAARARIEKILAEPTPDSAALGGAVQALEALPASGPDASPTAALRSRLLAAIGAAMQRADSLDAFDTYAAMLRRHADAFGTQGDYAALVAGIAALRDKLQQTEQARIAARSGELVLNAYPWANVESVRDAQRHPVALPDAAATPLVLKLPAGSYAVTFRHPKIAKPIRVIAVVRAGQRADADAAFSGITSQEYFKRAGW